MIQNILLSPGNIFFPIKWKLQRVRIYNSIEMANQINTSLQNVCGMFSTKFIQIRYREEMDIGIILCQDLI